MIYQYTYQTNFSKRDEVYEDFEFKVLSKKEIIIKKNNEFKPISREYIDSSSSTAGYSDKVSAFRMITYFNNLGLIEKREIFSDLGELSELKIYKYE